MKKYNISHQLYIKITTVILIDVSQFFVIFSYRILYDSDSYITQLIYKLTTSRQSE